MLRSYEYQALSSSINTLYSLNPVALNQGSFDVLHPRLDENHNLEYLPGARQAHNGREQEMTGNGAGSDLITQASFIPLATSQGQGIPQYPSMHRADTSQVSQGSQITQGNFEPVHTYGDTKTGHGQIGSNILMYPPSQGPNMQVKNIAMPHMSTTASKSVGQPATSAAPQVRSEAVSLNGNVGYSATSTVPLVRNEPASLSSAGGQLATFTAAPGRTEAVSLSSMVEQPATFTAAPVRTEAVSLSSMVGQPATLTAPLQVRSESALLRSTGMSTAQFLYNPYQHLPGQVDSNVQAHVKPDHPVSRSTEPPSISRGIPTLQAAPIRSLQTMPCAAPSDPTTTRQLGSATQAATSDMPQQHQQPLQQVQSQPTAKLEQPSKSRGFVPVSKGMTGGLPAHQLRERLQNLANRQKSLAAKNSEQDVCSVSSILQSRGGTKEGKVPQNRIKLLLSLTLSPHLFFFPDRHLVTLAHNSSKPSLLLKGFWLIKSKVQLDYFVHNQKCNCISTNLSSFLFNIILSLHSLCYQILPSL